MYFTVISGSLQYCNGCGCGIPGTEHNVHPTQSCVPSFKVTPGPFQHEPCNKNIQHDPNTHDITAIKKIKNAVTGYPNNKAIMASMVPKKALSLFMISPASNKQT